jgi:hypothetical protein
VVVVNAKWQVLLLIILSAAFIGFETAGKVLKFHTMSIGYILGILCFLAALLIGSRNR